MDLILISSWPATAKKLQLPEYSLKQILYFSEWGIVMDFSENCDSDIMQVSASTNNEKL